MSTDYKITNVKTLINNNIFTNDLVLDNFDRMKRMLNNKQTLEKITDLSNPEKLRIDVLNQIFDSFYNSLPKDIDFLSLDRKVGPKQIKVIFPFDEKYWTGTVQLIDVFYCNNYYLVLNIKLPNDGFIYTDNYLDSTKPEKDILLLNSETVDFIENIIDKLKIPDNFLKQFIYNQELGRAEFKFKDEINKRMITLKYEYGTYNSYVKNITYTDNDFKNIIKLLRKPREVADFG